MEEGRLRLTDRVTTNDRRRTTDHPPSPTARWLALAVTFIAFVARVWALGDASLWFDEGLSVEFAGRSLPALMDTLVREDLHPPLYYLLLHVWMAVAGQREFAVRFVSLVPGVLLIPLAYATVREVYHGRPGAGRAALVAGVPAAALVALSPFLIYYSQEARMYGLVACLALLSVLTLLRATRAPDPAAPPSFRVRRLGPWVAHSLALAATLYTQYLALFLLPALFLYAALSGWRAWRAWLLSAGLAGLLYAPWVGPAIAQIRRLVNNPDFFPAELSLGTVTGRILQGFLGIGSARLAGLAVGLVVGVLVLALGRRWLRQRDLARREALPVLAAVLPILLTAAAVTVMPKFAERYAIVAAPALIIALTLALFTLLWRGWGRWLFGIVALGAIAWSAPQAWSAAHTPWAPQEDARRLAAYLTERATAEHAILLMDDAPYAFQYYYRGAAPYDGLRVGFAFDHGADVLNRVLAAQPTRVWLVLWHHEFADPSGMVIAELERRSLTEPTVRTNFSGYTLMSYRLKDTSPVTPIPKPQQAVDAVFGDRLRLVGADRLESQAGALRWILYWQAAQTLDRDYIVALQLRDSQGQVRLTHTQSPSTPYLATAGFPVGVTLRGLTRVNLPPTLAPGTYEAQVLVWDLREQTNLPAVGADGRPLGIAVPLGRVELTPDMLKGP